MHSTPAPFLVATTHYILAIDGETGTGSHIHSGNGLYYGLARGLDGSIYAACRNTTEGPQNEDVRASELGSILIFNRNLEATGALHAPFPLRDVHGIACFDNRLWVSCSYDNLIAIYDFGVREWSQWYPSPDPNHRGRDVHHFNTVCFFNNKVCLVAHNFGPSELWFFDYPSFQFHSILPLGNMAHDVFEFQGALATCNSAGGCIVNTCGQELQTGGFPRGVGITTSGNLVGISACANRADRADQDALLRWYSPDWRFRKQYMLPDAGMVLNILPLGSVATGLKDLENLQEAMTHSVVKSALATIQR